MRDLDPFVHPRRANAEDPARIALLDSPDPLFDAFESEPPRRPGTQPVLRGAAANSARRRPTAPGAVALVFSAALFAAGCLPDEAPPVAQDAVLVQLRDANVLPQWTRSDESESGPAIVPLISVGGDDDSAGSGNAAPLIRVPLLAGEEPRALAAELARDPAVAFAEPIELFHSFASSRTPDDPRFRDLWGLAEINAPEAWGTTVGDKSVVVAVIDNGVALTHPDLQANLWTNPGEVAGNGLDDDDDGIVDDVHGASFLGGVASGDPSPVDSASAPWHGTHVAGIVGAVGDNRVGVVGVAWKVSLMAVRALSASGGRSDDLVRAIDYASAHGARVINASWGGVAQSQAVEQAIARAGTRGALFIAAAGNDGASAPAFPASFGAENLISVGALDPDGSLASFSNRGAMVAAPGVGILSTTSPGSYEREDGTSTAAPHVAGLAALLFAASPRATAAQVRAAILSSSLATEYTQSGRIDAAGALAALEGTGSEDPGALVLSRDSLTFAAASSEAPRAQTISVRAKSGAVLSFSSATSAPWASLVHSQFITPVRVTVRVDPSGLPEGDYSATIAFTSSDGASAPLEIALHVGAKPAITALGEACAIEQDGILHIRRGALCALVAPGFREDASAPDVSWRLPDGAEQRGARLTAIYPRPGTFTLLTSEGGNATSLAVQVE